MVATVNLPYNGTGIGCESICKQGNISLRNKRVTGFSFKARHTGKLNAVWVHVKAQTYTEAGNPGGTPTASSDNGSYGYGTGGNMRARVYANGSGNKPNYSIELARSSWRNGIRTNNIAIKNKAIKFDLFTPSGSGTSTTKFSIAAGTRYHILFENNASNTILNWASINWVYCEAGPRVFNPKAPWSPYYSDEVIWQGTSTKVEESLRHGPCFLLEIDPDGSDPVLRWGPINLLSHDMLEPQPPTSTASGGVYLIDGSKMLRQKFKVPRAMIISKVRVPLGYFGPSSGTGNVEVALRRHDGSARGALLAKATYTKSDALNLRITTASDYPKSSPWNNLVSGAPKTGLKYIEKSFASTVSLNTSDLYYLEFSRTAGNLSYFLMVNTDAVRSSNVEDVPVTEPSPEGWSSGATATYCSAEWYNSTDGWQLCSPTGSTGKSFYEVCARLII